MNTIKQLCTVIFGFFVALTLGGCAAVPYAGMAIHGVTLANAANEASSADKRAAEKSALEEKDYREAVGSTSSSPPKTAGCKAKPTTEISVDPQIGGDIAKYQININHTQTDKIIENEVRRNLCVTVVAYGANAQYTLSPTFHFLSAKEMSMAKKMGYSIMGKSRDLTPDFREVTVKVAFTTRKTGKTIEGVGTAVKDQGVIDKKEVVLVALREALNDLNGKINGKLAGAR